MDDYNEQNTDFHPAPEIFSGSPASAPARRGRLLPNGCITRHLAADAPQICKNISDQERNRIAAERALIGFVLTKRTRKDVVLKCRKTLAPQGRKNTPTGKHPISPKGECNEPPFSAPDLTQDEINRIFRAWRDTPSETKLIWGAYVLQEQDSYSPFTLNLSPTLIHRAYYRTGMTFASALREILAQHLRREFGKQIPLALVVEVDPIDDSTGRPHVHGFLDLPRSRKAKAKARSAMHAANDRYATPEFNKRAVALHTAHNGVYWASSYMPKHIDQTRQFIDEDPVAVSRSITQAGRDCYDSQVRIVPPKPKHQVSPPIPPFRDIKPRPDALRDAQGVDTASTATPDAKTSENGLELLSEAPIKPNPTPKKPDHFPDPLGRIKPPGMSDIDWIRITRPSCQPKPKLTAGEFEAMLDDL